MRSHESPSSAENSLVEKPRPRRGLLSKRNLIIAGVAGVLVVLGIGLGVGLGLGLNRDKEPQYVVSPSHPSPTSNSTVNSSGIWRPTAGTKWNLELLKPRTSNNTQGIAVWDIDLFDNDASIIKGMKANGARVICYFSAGSYENWRPDKNQFAPADLGKVLDGWPDERWLNTNSSNVRKIMQARMDLAVSKSCDGIDPDNVDGFDNDNGVGLSEADGIDYLRFLAKSAAARNLAIGLKNAGSIIPNVIDVMQWSVNEQCEEYDECDTFQPFIKQNKPVFHVEYPKGANTNNNVQVSSSKKNEICSNDDAKGFSTIIKNMNLDTWIQTC